MIKSRAEKAMKHQKISLTHDAIHNEVFDMSDPGTGKTPVRIWAFASRRRRFGGCLLVLAPRSLLRATWVHDFTKFAPDLKVSVATASTRDKALAIKADVYITNHDAVKHLIKMPKEWFEKFSDLVVDESTAYKHHTSQRSRAIAKLAHMRFGAKPVFKHKALLSATPTSNGICDIWHQVYLLDGGKALGQNFFGFRNTVCTPTQVGRNANAVHWRDKDGAEEAVFGLINHMVIRHRFQDCVDIPTTHIYTVEYELEEKQRKAYNTMQTQQLLLLSKTKVTAIHAASVATKLLQISSGAVYDGTGKYVIVDKGRYEMLIEMASVRKHPLVLFYWQHQRDLLAAEAKKAGLNFCIFDGNTTDFERNQMVTNYQANKYDLMLGHPQTVAHGLTLTEGTTILWSGPTYNLEWWLQANRRQARIGQKYKTEVITLIAPNTIEQQVYNICANKDARMGNLLDLFQS